MYDDYGNIQSSFQALVIAENNNSAYGDSSENVFRSNETGFKPGAEAIKPDMEIQDQNLDPLAKRVMSTVNHLLTGENLKQVTIKDVVEHIPAGDSVIRDRLNHLTELGYLDCLPGSGRRPSYYYLADRTPTPEEQDDLLPEDDETLLMKVSDLTVSMAEEIIQLEAILEKKRQDLESLKQDREALESAIEVKRRMRDRFKQWF